MWGYPGTIQRIWDPTDIGLHYVLVHVLYSSTQRDILGLLGDYWAVQVPSHCTVYVHIMGDYHSTHDPAVSQEFPKPLGILGTVETLDGNPGQHSFPKSLKFPDISFCTNDYVVDIPHSCSQVSD